MCQQSLGQTMLVIEQVAVFDSRWARPQKTGAALSDGMQLPSQGIRVAPASLAGKAFTQRDGNGAGHGLAGQSRQVASEQTGFVILDVETHGRPHGRKGMFSLPYAASQLRATPVPARTGRTLPSRS